MIIAVVISIGLMIIASKPLTNFGNKHPTVIMLCLVLNLNVRSHVRMA